MSEYQYYEFLALDRPLTAEEIAALRALSTRAHITPVSFTNEYQWGNFKGNPDDLMRQFFDYTLPIKKQNIIKDLIILFQIKDFIGFDRPLF
jgi:hypothetical protein